MAKFRYKARTINGGMTTAVIDALDSRSAMDKLKALKLTVVELKEEEQSALSQLLRKLNPFKPSASAKELVLFSRQFSTLVTAGVPIVQGLTILVDQAETPYFKSVISKLREDIEQGISITDSMKKHPKAFTELYISMIKAGEVGGILDTILERLSTYLESAEELKGKVKSAMVYPAVISCVACGITLFLLIFVIPTFQKIFQSFGAELPLPTRILIGLSEILRHYIILVLAAPFAIFWGFQRFRSTEKGLFVLDSIALKLPVFGMLIRKVSIAKFARTLGTLIKSGVPILQALDTVAKTSGNRIIELAINSARDSIKEGERMAEPLKKTGVFPAMVVQMIAIGEETGSLDMMLVKIADFYDQEVDAAVKGLTSMIEPLIIVCMGVLVGGIVMAMFMPMFEMGSLASKGG